MEVMQPSRPLEPNPPASLAKGTPADEARSARLLAYLDAESPLEDVAQRAQREMLLNELNTLLKEWIRELAVSKAIYPDYESAAEAGGKLYIAGSYRCAQFVLVHWVEGVVCAPHKAGPLLSHLLSLHLL